MHQPCVCGSGKEYQACCEPFVTGKQLPSSPEALMRSRYTAYTQANIAYIEQTQRDRAAVNFDAISAKAWAEEAVWKRLDVLHAPPAEGDIGTVIFKAYYDWRGEEACLYEFSHFKRVAGRWYFVSCEEPNRTLGRNDPCLCGSGKKYKKCCLG